MCAALSLLEAGAARAWNGADGPGDWAGAYGYGAGAPEAHDRSWDGFQGKHIDDTAASSGGRQGQTWGPILKNLGSPHPGSTRAWCGVLGCGAAVHGDHPTAGDHTSVGSDPAGEVVP